MSTSRTRDARPWILLIAAFIILFDRVTKIWVSNHIDRGHFLTIIPGIFRLSHVFNTHSSPSPSRLSSSATALSPSPSSPSSSSSA